MWVNSKICTCHASAIPQNYIHRSNNFLCCFASCLLFSITDWQFYIPNYSVPRSNNSTLSLILVNIFITLIIIKQVWCAILFWFLCVFPDDWWCWASYNTVAPWFTNTFVCQQFGLNTETCGNNLFLLRILYQVMNTMVVIFSTQTQSWPSYQNHWKN